MLLPSGVLTTQRQSESMKQLLPPVTADTSYVIDIPRRTLIARKYVTMKASPALSSLDC